MMSRKVIDERLKAIIDKYSDQATARIGKAKEGHSSSKKSECLGYAEAVRDILYELLHLRLTILEE